MTTAQVGFHAHENLALGVANSIAAIRAGAVQIDGSTRRFGAGAGNAPSEALVAVCDKLGIRTGIDVFKMFDAAEDVVRGVMSEECTLDRLSLVMGYSGVYSSFLKHAYRAAERYGVSGAEILVRAGERKLVGGQEDQLLDIAVELAAAGARSGPQPSASRGSTAAPTSSMSVDGQVVGTDVLDQERGRPGRADRPHPLDELRRRSRTGRTRVRRPARQRH